MSIDWLKTEIGYLEIYSVDGIIYTSQFIDDDKMNATDSMFKTDIQKYFSGMTKKFTSKFKLTGTTFQIKVWKEIMKIPYGQTKTYTDIAKAIGHEKSYRAVANACNQNKIAPFVPCHRVVGKNNNGGYKYGMEKKQWLLDLERDNLNK